MGQARSQQPKLRPCTSCVNAELCTPSPPHGSAHREGSAPQLIEVFRNLCSSTGCFRKQCETSRYPNGLFRRHRDGFALHKHPHTAVLLETSWPRQALGLHRNGRLQGEQTPSHGAAASFPTMRRNLSAPWELGAELQSSHSTPHASCPSRPGCTCGMQSCSGRTQLSPAASGAWLEGSCLTLTQPGEQPYGSGMERSP